MKIRATVSSSPIATTAQTRPSTAITQNVPRQPTAPMRLVSTGPAMSRRGLEIGATVDATFLRGQRVWADGKVEGTPTGRYQHRPTSL